MRTWRDSLLPPRLRRGWPRLASSPSPRWRGEGRDEGLSPQAQTRGKPPHPDPLPASGERERRSQRSGSQRNRKQRVDLPTVEDNRLFGEACVTRRIEDDAVLVTAGGEQDGLAGAH